MTHTLFAGHCDCERCERDRFEAKAVSVILLFLCAMGVGLLFVIGVFGT